MFKRMKVVSLALAVAAGMVLASTSYGVSDSILFNGAGSSAAFNAFALAARVSNPGHASGVCGNHNWTLKSGGLGIDNRTAGIDPVAGNIWIVWGDPVAGIRTVCSYLNVDSIQGNRLFFAVPKATLSLPGISTSTAGGNIVPLLPPDETLPADVINTLNGHMFNAAPSDIRPEDALFGTTRALTSLAKGGLGYGPPPVGAAILSHFSTKLSQIVDYAISGLDPISGGGVPAYTTVNVGAQVMLVLVNSTDTASGHLGSATFKNVDRFVLAKVLDGTLGCTRDLAPATGLPSVALTVLEREPLSGTFNTMEFTIPRSVEVGSSQEAGVEAMNPMDKPGPCGSARQRVIGTGEMVATVVATTDSLGYTFFSFGNVAPAAGPPATAKYLAVDGVDPLQSFYTGGTLPTCTAPCPGKVTFPNVLNGSYPIWNVLRVVTTNPASTGVLKLVTAAQTEVLNIPDFVPFSKLTVFRSHYLQSGVAPRNGHKARTTDAGGDVGGAVFTVQADDDFIADTGTELVNYKQ
jgi:ABC-type phosphate transport system substrate-binding protein